MSGVYSVKVNIFPRISVKVALWYQVIYQIFFGTAASDRERDKLTDAARKGDKLADLGFGIEIVG